MYCKDCKFRLIDSQGQSYCSSEKLTDDNDFITFKSDGNRLIYSLEGGRFQVEDFFGCVHFEERIDDRILYACGYDQGNNSYGMWAGPHPSLIEMEKHQPEEQDLDAVIIRLSDSVIIRRWVDGQWTNSVLS